jgi:hypothetical protein
MEFEKLNFKCGLFLVNVDKIYQLDSNKAKSNQKRTQMYTESFKKKYLINLDKLKI